MKKLLFFFCIFSSFVLNAQTFYWVGGSGYWNDATHWSNTSGGSSNGKVPTSIVPIIFDNNSSSLESFTIHATQSFVAKSIVAENTNFKIDIISSPDVDLTVFGGVTLNQYFFIKTNGNIYLNPQKDEVYQFSHNKLNNNIYINSSNAVQLGTISILKTLFLSGSLKLKNSVIITDGLNFINATVELNNNIIQTSNSLIVQNSQLLNNSSQKSTLICKKDNLSASILLQLNSVPNLKLSRLAPAAGNVTLVGVTNPICRGFCNGTATFSLTTFSDPPFIINWSNINGLPSCQTLPVAEPAYVAATYSVGGLCACVDQYSVLFTNSLLPFPDQILVAVPITEPPPTILNFTPRPPTCFGLCDGQIRATVSGETPLSINWNPPGLVQTGIFGVATLTNACAGIYTVTATNVKGCIATVTTTLLQPPLLLANGTRTNITCNSFCTGVAQVAPTGGTPPFSYVWSPAAPGSSSTVNSGLCAGVVTASVTDSRTCTSVYTATITQPPAITVTVNQTNLICGSICDGSSTVTATGGSGLGYTYTWTPNVSTSSIAFGLCVGNYTVDVMDNLLCRRTVTFQITSPPTLTASPTQTNVNCFGVCIGSVNLNPSGGNPAYTYVWSPSVSTNSFATALCAGVYSYTVTDVLACRFSSTLSITQPPPIVLSISNTSITCFSTCNGTALANLSGGTGPYTYTWSPGSPIGQSTGTISSLCPATYSLAIRDALGCARQSTTTIIQPLDITISTTSVAPTCSGICDGVLNVATSGGNAPYTFTLQPAIGAPIIGFPPFGGLCVGFYTLRVRDNVGCIRTQTINLTEPNPILLSLNSTSISCAGQCNASISALVSGGTPLYSYLWNNGSTAPFLINQCTGVYSATVTDNGGCRAVNSITVTAPSSITVAIVPTNPNCSSFCSGIATAAVSGGTPGYNISWTNGNTGNISSNLCQGTYTATVIDLLNCIQTQTIAIITPPALTLTVNNGSTNCSGSCDGTVSVTPSGGTAGYNISWNSTPTQTTALASNLCFGTYFASVTDNLGCLATISADVLQPTALTATINSVVSSCNVCIGSATAGGIGGTAPYTYSWSPGGQSTAAASGLCVGIQTVVVTDFANCVTSQIVNIAQTVIVLATSNGNTLTCNGGCSGIASANASGGVLPYSYTWTPTAPTQSLSTATGLCSGTYSVIVRDANGCSNIDQVTFINPPAITLTINQTSVTCNGLCDGTASALAFGGLAPLNYLWLPGGQTAPAINGLCAGVYTLTVTDFNSCSQSQTIAIVQSSSITANFTSINPTGCALTNGSITHTISGGAAPLTFTWVPGGSVNPLINLPDGFYVLNIRDANGCLRSDIVALSDPLGATVTVTSNSIACFGLCTGSASLAIIGAGPFAINWPTIPSISPIVSSLCAGIYPVQITDVNTCVTNQTVSITQPPILTSSGVVSNVTCGSACTGSVNLTLSGGVSAYSYSWIPSGGIGQDPTGLCAGNYTVNMRDANLCALTNTFAILQPSTVVLNFTSNNVLCNGGCTGAASVTAVGGSAPYTYVWTPLGAFAGSVLNNIVNLCTGIYSVSVTDFNGCVASGTVSIGEPAVLTSSVSLINNLCNGVCNGSATLTASGGTLPYNFSYNTFPATTTQTVGLLCTGSYIGTVSDFNGCLSTNMFVITQPLPIVVTSTLSNPRCNAVCNGSISTTVNGGTAAYSYAWVPSGSILPSATGLCAGNHTVTVTDLNLCTGQALVTLVNPPVLVANVSFTNSTCGVVCTGVVTSNPIGGTGPFTYSWLSPLNTNQTVSGLCAGDYTVVVTDAQLCQDTQTLTLIAPSAVFINPVVTPASCGISNGAIIAVPSTTVSNPYTYNWLAPLTSTNSSVSGLAAGIYTVVVTNSSLCSSTITIPLSNSNGPTGSTISTTNVACNSQCNGAAAISNPVGGTAPYILSWTTPASASQIVTNLCAGNYTSRIQDVNGCLFFENTVITQPLIISDNATLSSASCFGNCNGSIALSPTGGNGGYTYVWSNSGVASTISSLCPGNYSVTILDALNCSLTTSYNLPSLTTITSSTLATNNNCFNYCNGTLFSTSVAGGLPPYSYNWSDPIGQSTPLAIGLCNGNYSITITDANGCFSEIPASVTSPSQVTFTPNISQPSCDLCNGSATISPVGGTPAYSLTWSNTQTGPLASSLCAGIYAVQITDGNGCVSNTNVIVNSSSGATSELITKANTSCFGVCDGTVSVSAIGGALPITYNWLHNGSSSQFLTGLCAGTYFCNMTDLNGCTRTASVVINSLTTMTVSSQVTQSSCIINTGSIVVSILGGSGVYSYAWSPSGGTLPTATNLSPGSYTLTINDGFCSEIRVFTIGTLNGPVIILNTQNITCSGTCIGSASLTITGGTPVYTTLWSNGSSANSVSSLCIGNYSVIVTDNLGCVAIRNFSISNSIPVVFSTPDIDSPRCKDECNGSLNAIPSGGTLPFTFSWTPSVSLLPSIISLCSGVYSLTVTDGNGCVAIQSYTLINPTTMTLNALAINATCSSNTDGSINITNGGGTMPYTYTWTPGSINTASLTNIGAGSYSLSITDFGGCKKDTVITVISTVTVNAIAGNDSSFCQNGLFTLNGSSSIGTTYQWVEIPLGTVVSNTTIVSITPSVGTSTYVLTATTGLCIDKDTIIITSNALPFADAGPFVNIPLLTTVVLGGSPTGPSGSAFSWLPNYSLSSITDSNPTSSTTITTIYTVTVVDANGCRNSDTVTVFVYPEIIIPNGFTPNNDGKNDYWQLDLITLFPNVEVEVYNRWGEQLYFSKGYNVPFNGLYNGKQLPVGTYYYVINLNNIAYPKPYTGPLTIFR